MSFLAPSIDAQSIEYIKQRSAVDQPDLDEYLKDSLDVPVINIGPWGREYHQCGERVNRHYAFNLLPELVFKICQRLLKENL
jgi:arginine utilization protein RocB